MGCLLDSGKAEFEPPEHAAIAYAEELTVNPAGVSDSAFAELQKHWNPRQVVEITATACLFNSFNRFNNALGVDPTVYPKSLDAKPAPGCA